MDAYRIHDMLEDVSEAASTELAKGTEQVNTKEFGEVVDMIKDLTEAEKNKAEACYYNTLIDAMENADYGEDYDEYGPIERRGYDRMGYRGQGGGSRGSRGSRSMSSRRSYPMEDMMYDQRRDEYMQGRMGYSNGAYGGGSRGMTSSPSSRYGYSHDEYMQNRRMYSSNSPEDMQKKTKMIEERMDDLYGMFKDEVKDMSPEEKQVWKTKLNRIINL